MCGQGTTTEGRADVFYLTTQHWCLGSGEDGSRPGWENIYSLRYSEYSWLDTRNLYIRKVLSSCVNFVYCNGSRLKTKNPSPTRALGAMLMLLFLPEISLHILRKFGKIIPYNYIFLDCTHTTKNSKINRIRLKDWRRLSVLHWWQMGSWRSRRFYTHILKYAPPSPSSSLLTS